MNIDRVKDCEYDLIDRKVADCKNEATHVVRQTGHVVCAAHVDSARAFFEAQFEAQRQAQEKLKAAFAKVQEANAAELEKKHADSLAEQKNEEKSKEVAPPATPGGFGVRPGVGRAPKPPADAGKRGPEGSSC